MSTTTQIRHLSNGEYLVLPVKHPKNWHPLLNAAIFTLVFLASALWTLVVLMLRSSGSL